MTIPANTFSSYLVKTTLFSLTVQPKPLITHIGMHIFTSTVNTRDIPHTLHILKQKLPTILRSQCFNDEKLPFAVEVKQTEIGHLFEHILLEYLCLLKVVQGVSNISFSGETNWNWKKHPWGTFHIKVSAGYNDRYVFQKALEKSANLVTEILGLYRRRQFQ